MPPKRKATRKSKHAASPSPEKPPAKKAKRITKAKLRQLLEEKEREGLADAVVSLLLEGAPEGDRGAGPPPALYRANELTSPQAAPRAVWNATLRGEEGRLAKILDAHRQLRNATTNEPATEEQVRVVLERERALADDVGAKRKDLKARGLRWVHTIDCPSDPTGRGRNAFAAALQLGHVGCAKMLLAAFGAGRVANNLSAIVQTSNAEIPLESLEFLFESGHGWSADPHDVARQMAVAALYRGRRDLARRLLRFLLGLPLSLEDEPGFVSLEKSCADKEDGKPKVSVVKSEEMAMSDDGSGEDADASPAYKAASQIQEGLRFLHLAALEAKSTEELVAAAGGQGLCADTVNAPALGMYVTPMHLAAINPNVEIFKHLLEHGGDLTIATDDDWFPLTVAVAGPDGTDRERTAKSREFEDVIGPNPVVRFLLEDPSEEIENENQHYVKDRRRTMINNALSARRLHTMAWLLFYFDEDDSKRYYAYRAESSLITSAAAINDVRFVKMLTLHPAFRRELRSENCTVQGGQLLGVAIGSGCFGVVRALVAGELALEKTLPPVVIEGLEESKKGKDPLVAPELGQDHLEAAMKSGQIEFAEELVQTHGVKLDVPAVEANIPILHTALGRDDVDFVKLFLSHGASPRSRSVNGTPAIVHAIQSGSLACVDLLLGAGVSLDLEKEDELYAKEEKEKKSDAPDDTDANLDVESPFEGWFIVLTGVFTVSKSLIQSVVEANGGKIQNAVNSKTTHCCYSGRDGINDYGQKMGSGDKKYKESKRRRLPFIDEATITRYLHHTNQQVARLAGAQEGGPTTERKDPVIFSVIQKCAGGGGCGSVPLVDVLKFLLERGADHCQLNAKGQNVLTFAIERLNPNQASDVAAVECVLGIIGTEKIDEYDETGMTPLLAAIAAQKWGFVRLILNTGQANVNNFAKDPVVSPEKTDVEKEEDSGEEGGGREDQGDPNAKYNKLFGWNCLHLLVRHKQTELFSLAVEHTKERADLNARTMSDDETPLVLLSCHSFDICKCLLNDPSVDVCAQSAQGKNLLHVVFGGATVGCFAKVGEDKQRPQDSCSIPPGGVGFGGSNRSNHFSQSYHFGGGFGGGGDLGQVAIQSLINFKRWCPAMYHRNLSAADSEGMTPLHYCVNAVQGTACARMLLDDAPDLLEKKNRVGNTPLACALLASREHVATYLLEREADLNGSIFTEKEETVASPGAGVSRKIKKVEEISMYEFAMKHNLVGVVFAMLQHKECNLNATLAASIGGANLEWAEHLLNALDVSDGKFAAHLVQLLFKCSQTPDTRASGQLLSLVKRLAPVCKGCDPGTDDDGNTLLHHFVTNRHAEDSLSPLLDALGEKIVSSVLVHQNSSGQTPVHVCVRLRQVRLLRLLLDLDGAQKTVLTPDNQGNTPLHLSLSFNSQGVLVDSDVLSMLVASGGDLLACNQAGESAASALGQLPDFQCERLTSSLPHGTLERDDVRSKISDVRRKRDEAATVSAAKRDRSRMAYAESLAGIKGLWAKMEANRKRAGEVEDERQRKLAKCGRLAIPVNQRCSGHQNYEVYVSEDGDVYDAVLQSSEADYGTFGSNKFHSIQLLVIKKGVKANTTSRSGGQLTMGDYARSLGVSHALVYEMWGRTDDSLYNHKQRRRGFRNLKSGLEYFEQVFGGKTKSVMGASYEVQPTANYTWVKRLYEEKRAQLTPQQLVEQQRMLDSSMPKEVSLLLRVITDLSKIRRELRGEGVDTTSLPLGQTVSQSMIMEGYRVLEKISQTIAAVKKLSILRGKRLREQRNEVYALQNRLKKLTNQLYSALPRGFGSVDMGNISHMPTISSEDAVKKEATFLRSLEDVEETLTLVLGATSEVDVTEDTEEDYATSLVCSFPKKLTRFRDMLGVSLRPIEKHTDKFKLLEQYAHASSPNREIVAALRVTRYEDAERFAPFEADRQHNDSRGMPCNRLLFHSTKVSNCVGILMRGLKIAPEEAPTSGFLFGKGIYFADAFEKSAGYAHSRSMYERCNGTNFSTFENIDSIKVMFVCEVALGESHILKNFDMFHNPEEAGAALPPQGTNSVFAGGSMCPDQSGFFVTTKGVGVPLGSLGPAPEDQVKVGVQYNEYVVYDEARVKIKYIMLFR